MKRHNPSLNSLRAFEATARLLSFQQAAKEMNVTHSAVSHQIKKLENDLEANLFLRQGRRIQLTEVGRLYYQEIHAALRRIEQSTQELFGEPYYGDLIVQTYMGITARWLIQRLGDFRKLFPYLHVELQSSYFNWGFDREKADIGLIYTENPLDGLVYQPLFRGSLVPVCSPELIEPFACNSLNDLCKQPFLNVIESPKNLPTWLRAYGLTRNQIQMKGEHDNHSLALEAAVAGQGVAIVPIFFACGDIASGKLIIPFECSVPELGCWYFVQEEVSLNNSRAMCFAEWVQRELKKDPILQQYSHDLT